MFILSLIHCYFYRIGKVDLTVLYWFYLPLFVIVLTFQIIGISLRLTVVDIYNSTAQYATLIRQRWRIGFFKSVWAPNVIRLIIELVNGPL